MTKSKSVIYRGGIAVFHIPDHWIEEHRPDGGSTFYSDSPDSGTLRLNVLGFESKDTSAMQMAETVFRSGEVIRTRCGLPLRRSEKIAEENGEVLHITKWEVAVPISPSSLRLAVFSFTILAKQRSDPAFISEISMLEKGISEGQYSRDKGETRTHGTSN